MALWGSWGPLLGPLGSSQWPLATLSGGLRLLLGRSGGTLLTHLGSFLRLLGALLVLFCCSFGALGGLLGAPLLFFEGSQNALLAVQRWDKPALFRQISFFNIQFTV